MAARGLVLLPPAGRLSLIHAHDLADLLLLLAGPGAPSHLTLEPDDNRPGGWGHREFATAIADAVGRKARRLPMPAPLPTRGAAIDTGRARLNRRPPQPSLYRAPYFCHPPPVATAQPTPRPAFLEPSPPN